MVGVVTDLTKSVDVNVLQAVKSLRHVVYEGPDGVRARKVECRVPENLRGAECKYFLSCEAVCGFELLI